MGNHELYKYGERAKAKKQYSGKLGALFLAGGLFSFLYANALGDNRLYILGMILLVIAFIGIKNHFNSGSEVFDFKRRSGHIIYDGD